MHEWLAQKKSWAWAQQLTFAEFQPSISAGFPSSRASVPYELATCSELDYLRAMITHQDITAVC